MKLNVDFGRAVLVAILALGSPAALAALVDQGATTLDTDSNLLWLDMSNTLNRSAQSILGGAGGFLAAGWSFATIAQIDTLFTDAGMSGPFDGTGTSGNYLPAQSVVSLLGETYSFSGPVGTTHGIQAFSAEGTSATDLYTPFVYYTDTINVGTAISPAFTTPSFVANPTLGSWLVKTASVPEPGTGALLLGGLGLLAWQARRRNLSGCFTVERETRLPKNSRWPNQLFLE